MSLLQGNQVIDVDFAGITDQLTGLRTSLQTGSNFAVALVIVGNRLQRLLDQHLVTSVLAISVCIDPVPVVLTVLRWAFSQDSGGKLY